MSKRKLSPSMSVLEVLDHLADDVRELEFEAIGKDGHTCLIPKTRCSGVHQRLPDALPRIESAKVSVNTPLDTDAT